MRKFVFVAMLALTAGLYIAPAMAAQEQGEGKFTIHGEVRTRWEYLDNHNDLTDNDASGEALDDAYDIWPYRVRIAARGEFTENVVGYVELQNVGFFGNEDPEKVEPHPIDQVFWNNIDDSEVKLYQGWLELGKIGGSSWSLRIGRQEHPIGNELQVGDLDFYGGTSLDGVRSWWDWDKFTLTGFYYVVDDSNDAGCGAFCGDDSLDAWGVYGTWTFGQNPQVFEPYLISVHDGDAPGNASFYLLGGRYTRSVNSMADVEAMGFDWSAEFAMESGTIDPNGADLDISASIFEGWFGYNFAHGSSRSRVYIGGLVSSGDEDPADNDFEEFIPLLPDVWDHNRLGDADFFGLENITDWNLGYQFFSDKHTFRASIHSFTLTEDAGLPSDDLGQEVDVAYGYNYSSNVGIDVGVADLEPGDLFDGFLGPGTGQDTVLRVWAQARLRW